jgi:GNAT superfamily N-acetyltransferase
MCSEEGAPARPEVAALQIRRLQPAHKDACQGFSCGNEEWQREVSDYLTRKYWLPGRSQEEALVAFISGTEDIYGFGAWKHTHAEHEGERIPVIRVAYFGVDTRYQGARDAATNQSWTGRLYATLEQQARTHPQSTSDMRFELYCDHRNEDGLEFWQSRGYQIVHPAQLVAEKYLQLLRVPE